MPRKPVWTGGQDAQIRRLRTEGASWDVIAVTLGLTSSSVIERARFLGSEHLPAHAVATPDEADRPPLWSGHAETWGIINRGTSLEGIPFKIPDAVR